MLSLLNLLKSHISPHSNASFPPLQSLSFIDTHTRSHPPNFPSSFSAPSPYCNMKRCAMEQTTIAACHSRRDSVVCPKPRRLRCNQAEMNDLKAGAELLDIILSKGSGLERSCNQVASSPPFFCGSPPSRVSNPLVQDEQFGSENFKTLSPVPTFSASPSSFGRKGGCVRAVLGQKPAAVRIEGFDCLSRDRQNCSISAFA